MTLRLCRPSHRQLLASTEAHREKYRCPLERKRQSFETLGEHPAYHSTTGVAETPSIVMPESDFTSISSPSTPSMRDAAPSSTSRASDALPPSSAQPVLFASDSSGCTPDTRSPSPNSHVGTEVIPSSCRSVKLRVCRRTAPSLSSSKR